MGRILTRDKVSLYNRQKAYWYAKGVIEDMIDDRHFICCLLNDYLVDNFSITFPMEQILYEFPEILCQMPDEIIHLDRPWFDYGLAGNTERIKILDNAIAETEKQWKDGKR